MPKMRGIGVPVNDYFVEDFVDIPEFRYHEQYGCLFFM